MSHARFNIFNLAKLFVPCLCIFSADVGDPLFLTPYIDSGDLTTAQDLAKVVEPLDGVEDASIESYSGFITVNKTTNSNTFFWFFPAMASRARKHKNITGS